MARVSLTSIASLLCYLLFPLLVLSSPIEKGGRVLERQSGNQKKPSLRILALGASITWGSHSSTGNGYRKPLRDYLRYNGWDVNMVGSRSNGDMKDSDVEAKPGNIITAVRAAAVNSLHYKPNVVLINAGTNDCRLSEDIPNAGNRMRSLIMETLLNAEDMQDTLIVLSTLIPSGRADIERYRNDVNDQYRDLVAILRDEGVSIVLADMDPLPEYNDPWIRFPNEFTSQTGVDDTHPNDEGYRVMARIWADAVEYAHSENLIPTPATVEGSLGKVCEKDYGNGIYAGGLTQKGSGLGDGIYYHESEAQGVLFSTRVGEDEDLDFFFARLVSRSRDDLLVFNKDSNTGVVTYDVYLNSGQGTAARFQPAGTISAQDNCNARGVHFIDLNGDGLDDFVCIALDGTAYASVNNGNGEAGVPPTFTYIGRWKSSEGSAQANVRLADIDGDGRADYCVLAPNGDVTCWRNGWIDDVPAYWQPLGKRFTGKGMGDLRGVRFEDINGDGRDDWLWVDDDGATFTYTNSRSCITGREGDGLNVLWRQGFYKGQDSGPTHSGMGSFPGSGRRDRVHFARIFGEPQDFGLLGRQDYVYFNRRNLEGTQGALYEMHVWKNTGYGATKIRADGNRYCNMMGHSNGMMDYVWILSKGRMELFPNKGIGTINDDESYWGPSRFIWDPTQLEINRPLDRRDLHLIDWDGDGACDIVWTDPDNNNRVQLWRNRILETGDFNWQYDPSPAPALYCPERRGIGLFDLPVHFADISGNKRADYLCVEKDGRTWGFLQSADGSNWEYINQFKFAENRDRANLQWADVNGDGMADLIHTNKFNGDGTVWYNRGRETVGGSQFRWDRVGVKYQGAVAGSCTYFPDLNGDGRADMHAITHSTINRAETWYNNCALKDNGGDDGPLSDPNLPDFSADPDPEPCQTVSPDSYPAVPAANDLGEPIEGTSFFYISSNCFNHHGGGADNPRFANRGEFMKAAYKDATILADSAMDWPLYGHDVSDLFFEKDAHTMEPYVVNISANFKAVAEWDNRKPGFDDYIVLDCQNGHDQRCHEEQSMEIVCHTTEFTSWFWKISNVFCCNPFFSLDTIPDIWRIYKDLPPEDRKLSYMRTSGSVMVHELMHARAITGPRGYMSDEKFHGREMVRILGPEKCAKAARMAKDYGIKITSINPDNYAQFASARYWQKRFGGTMPRPEQELVDPEGWVDYAFGSDRDNVCLVPPADFNCDCNENGCSAESAPCCATGTCSCDCTENGCSELSPSCCSSGTCQF